MPIERPPKLPDTGPSIFSVMSALANSHGAINLSQGFPGFPVDEALITEVSTAMNEGHVQYSPFGGHPLLVEAVQELIKDRWGMGRASEEINITAGATQALFASIMALIAPGDEVIILDPAYDCYDPQVRLAGGKPVHVPLSDDLLPDVERIREACNENTRMLVINNPHNPGTRVMPLETMDAIMELVREKDIYLLSDEVYEYISYRPYRSAMYYQMAEQVITVHSFGKSLHATGWKLGYLTAGAEIMKRIRAVHQNEVFCVNTSMQVGIANYLSRHPEATNGLSEFYKHKRNMFLGALEGSKWTALPCDGSYFAVLDYSAISQEKDTEFACTLTVEHGVASIPLSVFSEKDTHHKRLRFCFAKQEDELRKATEILCRI